MPNATLPILGQGVQDAPLDYRVSDVQAFTLLAVRALFDGTAAAADFLPCVQLVSSAGHVMAQSIGSTVTAGGSADVTFAPFLRGAASSPGGAGIQFDTDNQGGALLIETTNSGFAAHGLVLTDDSTSGIQLTEVGTGNMFIEQSGDGGLELHNDGNGALSIRQTGNGGLNLENDGSGGINLLSTVGDTIIDNNAGRVELGTSGGNKLLTFYVKDGDIHWLQGGNLGTQIMALKWNGVAYELHLQTGTSVHFDL